MNTFKSIWARNRKLIGFYLFLGIATVFLETYNVNIFKRLLDSIAMNDVRIRDIVVYSCLVILVCLLLYLNNYPSTKLSEKIYLDLKVNTINKIKIIDYKEYQKLGIGKLLQIIENGARAGKSILFDFGFRIIRELLPSMIFSMYFIAKIDLNIMLIILFGYILVFFITNLLLKYLYNIKKSVLINEEDLNKTLTRGIMELVVFRIYRRFGSEIEKSNKMGSNIIAGKSKMIMIHEAFFTIFAILIGTIKIIIICSSFLGFELSVGEVVALLTLVDKAYTPIAIFNVLYVQKKLDQVAYERYQETLNLPDDEGLLCNNTFTVSKGEIHFKQINYQYEDRNVLENINFHIKSGKSIAFVGGSGSGKSTLVKLVLGLLKYKSGSIKIDGQELSEINLNNYYKSITYISQDSPIFDGTIRENIIFDQKIDDDKIMEALEKVQLKEYVQSLEDGLDAEVGEKGLMLSGGERQRLALARVFLDNSKIIVLDEATSAMDNITENLVMGNILKYLENRTSIIVAHRLNSVENVDIIYALKESKIVDQGSFKELIKNSSYFQELWNVSGSVLNRPNYM